MSTLRITPNVRTSTKKFLKLSNKMLVDPTRIAYLKQMRKPAGGAQMGQIRSWEVGGLNGLADAQFLIISDEVAQGLREDLAMTEVFDDQYKVSILVNMQQIAGIERNGSVVRFYTFENGKRACVLASMLTSTEPLGI